jgi:flagellin-specific chaperone FliS
MTAFINMRLAVANLNMTIGTSMERLTYTEKIFRLFEKLRVSEFKLENGKTITANLSILWTFPFTSLVDATSVKKITSSSGKVHYLTDKDRINMVKVFVASYSEVFEEDVKEIDPNMPFGDAFDQVVGDDMPRGMEGIASGIKELIGNINRKSANPKEGSDNELGSIGEQLDDSSGGIISAFFGTEFAETIGNISKLVRPEFTDVGESDPDEDVEDPASLSAFEELISKNSSIPISSTETTVTKTD